MTGEEKEKKYQEIKTKYEQYLPDFHDRKMTKKELAIVCGFGGKRPDNQLSTWIKEYEVREGKNNKPKEGELFKDLINAEELHNLLSDEDISANFVQFLKGLKENPEKKKEGIFAVWEPGLSNKQRSVRISPQIFEDWEKAMKEQKEFANLHQSQLLNITLLWALESLGVKKEY